jgi:hypothetical protein
MDLPGVQWTNVAGSRRAFDGSINDARNKIICRSGWWLVMLDSGLQRREPSVATHEQHLVLQVCVNARQAMTTLALRGQAAYCSELRCAPSSALPGAVPPAPTQKTVVQQRRSRALKPLGLL